MMLGIGKDFREEEDDDEEGSEDSNVFDVEKILDVQVIQGVKHYLVKWENYPHSDNTWEPIDSFAPDNIHIKEFLDERKKQIKQTTESGPKSKPRRPRSDTRKPSKKRLRKVGDIIKKDSELAKKMQEEEISLVDQKRQPKKIDAPSKQSSVIKKVEEIEKTETPVNKKPTEKKEESKGSIPKKSALSGLKRKRSVSILGKISSISKRPKKINENKGSLAENLAKNNDTNKKAFPQKTLSFMRSKSPFKKLASEKASNDLKEKANEKVNLQTIINLAEANK